MRLRSLPGRHQRTASHVRSCAKCTLALHRERQYLERLREAPIPPASEDLAARLLTRTHELAALPPVRHRERGGTRSAARVCSFTALGATATAGILAVGLYAVAGDPYISERESAAAAMTAVTGQLPAAGAAVGPDALEGLRAQGWVCPELKAMGFRLESARALVRDGQPALELQFTDGVHWATITEQRTANAVMDKPYSRILSTSPWSASYSASDRTFNYESSLPADRADDALPVLQRLAGAKGFVAGVGGPRPAGEEPVAVRLQRGASRIAAVINR